MNTNTSGLNESGASEVIGEMLMIALVVILLSVFSAVLFNFLPAGRDPSVSVMMTNDRQDITLWHKGGDWVQAEDLSIVIMNETSRQSFTRSDLILVPDKTVFDVGSNLTVRTEYSFKGDETVKLITPRTVVFSGRIVL
ncbi:type IV pilin [Methanoregula sp.]|uniref:type IV pilin n=1 Tax=Methanoregula sp. TaxID=2052170 RepID=UPI002613E6F7|nr:type IV pilin [Methanoregula sp.]MDD5142803.1 type IV pilin [Methanoregula sp.]